MTVTLFEQICTFKNLLQASNKTLRGKKHRSRQAALFNFNLEPELFLLQHELLNQTYQPQPYIQFPIRDPKPRLISAAALRDRVVHHAICQILEPIFERKLIFDSYACRSGKGTHKAIRRAQRFACKSPYFLKLDIRCFFASVDHDILLQRLAVILQKLS